MKLVAGVDIETTGLEWNEGHRIIEVAVVFYRLEDEREVGRWVQRINPERPIDPKALEVHGIPFEALTGEPTWDVVAPKLSKLLHRADVLMAHNGMGFDFPFIASELTRVGQVVPEKPLIDTMLDGRWATYLGKLPSLRELCFACGVEYDLEQAHGAAYDVSVMAKSFFNARRQGFFKIAAL